MRNRERGANFALPVLGLAAILAAGGTGLAQSSTSGKGGGTPAPESFTPGSRSKVPDLSTAPKNTPAGVRYLTFRDLANFPYDLPNAKVEPGKPLPVIPDSVKALAGKKILLEGYMVPLKFGSGKVTEFLLTSQPLACCFGGIPRVNEMVEVVMPKGKGAPPVPDRVIEVVGTLSVGEKTDAQGYLLSIYQMAGESVADNSKSSHHAGKSGFLGY